MSPIKKKLLGLFLLLLVVSGVHSCLSGEGNYDPSKYEAVITPASVQGGGDGEKTECSGLRVGSKVDLTLPDQFDVAHTIGPEITTLILAFTKDTGGVVRSYLDEQDEEYLNSHEARFIADISPFPALMRNAFALPKLRKSPYSVLLLYEKEQSRALKDLEHKDEITIVKLNKGIVVGLNHIRTEVELAEAFEDPAPLK